MNKIYCQNCTKYNGTTDNYPAEWCGIIVDDYYSSAHEIVATPAGKNSQNNCFFFEPKIKFDGSGDIKVEK